MDVVQYQLDNGMTVILQPQSAAPVVACNVWVGVGSADEEPREAGLAHVHEHMLFKGTARRGVGEIAREVESSGGHINAFTSFDQTCYYVVMSSRFFDTGLDILSDAIRNSSFDAEELARELEVIQEEIKRGNDHPPRVASKLLFETAFETHPYRLPVIGTSESVASFGRDDVVSFFSKHYVPGNMALVLVGDFELEEAKQLVDKYFGDFEGQDYRRPERPPEPAQDGVRVRVETRDIQESYLRIAFHVPDVRHQDIPALDLLGAIMGYGDASHLFQTIQRERELVNSIYAGAYTPMDAGLFIVSADYQFDEEGSHPDVLRPILEETFRFREMKVAEADIRRARTIIESQEIYNRQTVEGLAMKLGRYQMVAGDPRFEQEYYEELARVTADDIRRVARQYLTPQNCSVALLHPTAGPSVTEEELATQVSEALAVVSAEAIDTGIAVDSDGFARIEIPDGPTLVIQEDHAVETFSIRGLTLGGLRYETPENNGINALLNDLITRGTATRSALEIAREVESMAGGIHGISGRNSFGLAMSGLSKFFEPSFDIFADCLLSAAIPEDEFERERNLQIQTIRSRRDQLAAVNYHRFASAFFEDYPYAMPIEGSEETVRALTPQALRDYLDQLVRPQSLVISVTGDIEASHVAELVERYFVRPESAAPYQPDVPKPPRHTQRTFVQGDLEKEQAFVTVGFDAPPMGEDARFPLEVLYAILSGQGGRLFYELRDRQSLAYSVYASMVFGLDLSAFTINIGTSPEKVEQAVRGIFSEVHKLRDSGVTASEIERAKRYLIGNHDIGLQKNSSRAMAFGLDELYGFGYRKTLEFADQIEAVTSEDIDEVVRTYLDLDHATVAITKPEATKLPDDLLDF